jgi:hypothetical protein
MACFRFTQRVALAASLALLAACQPSELGPHDRTVVIFETGKFLDAWQAAGNEGRYGDLKPLYSNRAGFLWVEDGAAKYGSARGVAAALDQAAASNASVIITLDNRNITPLARDAAAVSANYTRQIALGEGGAFESRGMFTGTLIREGEGEDGQWKFLHGHFSRLAGPALEPLAPAEQALAAPASPETPQEIAPETIPDVN